MSDFLDDVFGPRLPRASDLPDTGQASTSDAVTSSPPAINVAGAPAAPEPAVAMPADMPAPHERKFNSILDAALAWAARGFRVFPLAPGTKVAPAGLTWKEAATTDPAKIRAWWAFEPSYNYAVAAGEGTLIVDVDAAKGGYASLLDLDLPDTLTVKTPGGGEHRYYTGPDVQNSVDRIAPGIDIRSAGGYVVGPGSFFADHDGAKGYTGTYHVINDAAPVAAPEALALKCGEPKQRDENRAPVSSDEPDDIRFAIQYLQNDAPLTKLGSGNNTTYAVAARVIEIGASPDKAFELMAEHWNPRLDEPWSDDELKRIIDHAAEYMQGRQGSKGVTAGAEGFGDAVTLDSTPAPAPALPLFRMQSLRERRANLETPQGIEWVYGSLFARKLLTVTVAAGGVGKSTLAIAEKLAIATGRPLLGVEVHRKSRVAYYNLEDGIDTADRAIKAALQHYGLSLDDPDVLDNIMVMSGRDAPVKIATADRGATKIIEPLIEAMVAWLRASRVKVLTIDPFVDTHAVPESDNSAINEVAKAWGRVAERADCAVHLVHHVRKLNGKRVEAEDARGAVALIAAARVTRTLAHVAEPNDMAALGIGEADARNYFLSEDGGKRNVGQASGKLFFRRASVPIAVQREGGAGYENVPVAVKAAITAAHATVELTPAQIEAIAVEIERRPTWRAENGNIDNRITWPIMKALGIDPLQHDSEDRADAVLKTLARRKIVKRLPLATPYSASLSRSGKKCPCYALAPREQWDGAADWSDAKTIEAKETDDEDA